VVVAGELQHVRMEADVIAEALEDDAFQVVASLPNQIRGIS
jgi:hypothetical protein